MKVTFKRTRDRAYSLTVEGPDVATAEMDPAPGYHDRLPHDVAHFIVENELGIKGGIFGQMAMGGTIRPVERNSRIQRKAKRKREEIFRTNKNDALFSEHAIWAAQSRWEKQEIIPSTQIPQADLDRVIAKFEEFANEWSKLPVGGSITLEWKPKTRKHGR